MTKAKSTARSPQTTFEEVSCDFIVAKFVECSKNHLQAHFELYCWSYLVFRRLFVFGYSRHVRSGICNHIGSFLFPRSTLTHDRHQVPLF